MHDPQLDNLTALQTTGAALVKKLEAASTAAVRSAAERSGPIHISLNSNGLVEAVTITTGTNRVDADALSSAVIEAIQHATLQRFTVWSTAMSSVQNETASIDIDSHTAPQFDHEDFMAAAQKIRASPMPEVDRELTLADLLAVAESIERGIDDMSAKLKSLSDSTIHGESKNREVTVTLTGTGEVTGLSFDKVWLRSAHEINIGRQITLAFRSAYSELATRGIEAEIDKSPLGEAMRFLQDADSSRSRKGIDRSHAPGFQ